VPNVTDAGKDVDGPAIDAGPPCVMIKGTLTDDALSNLLAAVLGKMPFLILNDRKERL
jgi:hypothetical protein